MLHHLLPLFALFTSFAILCLGQGLQAVLLPARAALEGYSDMTTGALMSAYYGGFIAGSFIAPWLITRVGHVRVFAAAASTASAIMLMHGLFLQPLAWLVCRVIYGFCLMHLYTIMESWLGGVGGRDTRGQILSIYMIVNFVSLSGGKLFFFSAPLQEFTLFAVVSIWLSLSVLPLILSRIHQPQTITPHESLSVQRLYHISPLGIVGAMVAGLMGGAYGGLAAVYVMEAGFTQEDVAWFMATSLLGGLLAQWPLGKLSDRINRRYVIALAVALICLASIGLTLPIGSTTWLLLLGGIFGAGLHPLYSLCLAHMNDFVEPEQIVRASTGLQLIQSIGALAGPLLAGGLMYQFGNRLLFLSIALLAAGFFVYIIWRLLQKRLPAPEMIKPFRAALLASARYWLRKTR